MSWLHLAALSMLLLSARLAYSRILSSRRLPMGLLSSKNGAAVTNVHIKLTSDEQNLFEMFREFVREKQLTTTVRVAGGWVRDKIMNTIDKRNWETYIPKETVDMKSH
jgi:hypothetical protein